MEETGETCKLCLKYIQGANLSVLDETLLGKLEFLHMDLEQSVEDSNSICKECEDKIENAFEFKSCLVNTESCLVPYVSEDRSQKVNLRVVVEKDNPSTSAEKEVCRLCKNFVDAMSVISLPKILKDDSMMEIFQSHIPEMDLQVTENPLVCETCQKSLASFSTLVSSWSIANGWNDEDMKEDFDEFDVSQVKKENFDQLSEETNSSISIVDASGSTQTSSKAKRKNEQDVKVKHETNEVSDLSESLPVNNKVVKKEEGDEVNEIGDAEMGDLQLKNEEVDIKDEDGDNRQLLEQDQKIPEEGTIYQCNDCSFKTRSKKSFKGHTKKTSGKTVLVKCSRCSFRTQRATCLRFHNYLHNINEDALEYYCDECPFKTKTSSYFYKHRKTHSSSYIPVIHKCNMCSFQTKYSAELKRHLRKHQHVKEKYKCEKCIFQAVCQVALMRHSLIHENDEDLFKCSECPYRTKSERNFRTHITNKHINMDL